MHTLLLPASLLATLVATTHGRTPAPAAAGAAAKPRVELAICLDTSGSMQGLIDAARRGIWAIVNDLALAKPAPDLRLSLLTFGNDGHDPAAGWVAIDTPFTQDLDLVSQKLFALGTNGGTELVGRVVQTALDRLDWSDDPQVMRLIVVAGNESADQDREVPYAKACRDAIGRGIMVNAIYCGNPSDNVAPGWRQVAELADGKFHAIDKDNGAVAIATPFDDRIVALSSELNRTYLPYGPGGQQGAWNQKQQDENAVGLDKQVAAQRAACKISINYCNSSWDLVDACRLQQVRLTEIPAAELPAALRGLSVAEMEAKVAELQKQREAIQAQIKELNAKREALVAAEMRERAADSSSTFDHAVRSALRAQAAAWGLSIPDPAAAAGGATEAEEIVPAYGSGR